MGSVNLLKQTFRIYILCSVAVFIIAAPIFYFSMVRLYVEETDETLLLHKAEFIKHHLPNFKQSDIGIWNQCNRNMKIESVSSPIAYDTFLDKSFLDTLESEYVPYRVLQSPIVIENKNYIFTSRINLVETEDLIERIILVFIVIIALLLGVLLFVTNQFSKKIWQPFRKTLEKLKAFDLSKGTKMLFEKTGIEEFDELNQSLQNLTDENISAYNQQKTFLENASHELQTPLAILKSKMDLLLQNKDITPEQSEILAAAELPIARITRINKNLLLLAKIENNQFADKEIIELTESINDSLVLLSDYITAKQIVVDKEFSEKLSIVCNKTLLEILINNLLVNAIVHNVEKGKIIINFSDKKLRVSNTGKIALNTEKLFERFAISSFESTNSGLGLAIIKEICLRYQWQIHYHFENGFHSFSIKFP